MPNDSNDQDRTPITLKPGYLVGLSTSVRGGVQYVTQELPVKAADEALAPEGATVEKKATTKITADAKEHERAIKVRSKARSLVTSRCIASPFGLLCPTQGLAALDEAIEEARQHVAEFNATAVHTHVDVWCIRGQIVESDTDAARGIAREMRTLIDAMQDGIAKRDPEAIRDAMRKAKALGGMLSDDVAGKVNTALDAARAAAKEIVRTVKERGDAAVILVADQNKKMWEEARFAFLDFDEPQALAGEALAPVSPNALDLDDDAVAAQPAPAPEPAVAIEVDEGGEGGPVPEAMAAAPEASPSLELN